MCEAPSVASVVATTLAVSELAAVTWQSVTSPLVSKTSMISLVELSFTLSKLASASELKFSPTKSTTIVPLPVEKFPATG